jgi:endogenous inhibitor of DNA gyrase (YacG/DUF329 family)
MANRDKPKMMGNDGNIYKCPICRTILAHANVPAFPFCSERCRLLDLSNWLEGKYTASRPVDPTDQEDENLPRKATGPGGGGPGGGGPDRGM